MLSVIGEAPVNTLAGALPVDVAVARNTLAETVREVQREGWHFNTEPNYPLPRSEDGQIILASSIFRVSLADPDSRDIVQRGNRVYDRTNHTYQFEEDLTATVALLLPFADLPDTFRWYVTVRAARKFQDRAVGSGDLHSFTERDEAQARRAAEREDMELSRPSLAKGEAASFLDGWTVGATLRR